MNTVPISAQHAQNDATDLKSHLVDSDKRRDSQEHFQTEDGLCCELKVMAVAQGTSAVMIWLYPFWAHWF